MTTIVRTWCLMLLAAALLTAHDGIAEPQNSALEASAFSCGGGVAASETFSVVATLGESSPVGNAASQDFALGSGFLGAKPACPGDCIGDERVTVDELLIAVNIALDNRPVADCGASDLNLDGKVTVDELLTAVNRALAGCWGA